MQSDVVQMEPFNPILDTKVLNPFLDKPETPTIDLNADPELLPEYFNDDHPWDVTILEAPICPKSAKIIRLVKSSPFDFDLRTGLKYHLYHMI